jgi:hypothetical protein
VAVARRAAPGAWPLLFLATLALGACSPAPLVHHDASFPVNFSERPVLLEGEVIGRAHRSGEMGREGWVAPVAVSRVWAGFCWADTVNLHFRYQLTNPGVIRPHAVVVVMGRHRDDRTNEIWGVPAVWNRSSAEYRYDQGVRDPHADDVILGAEVRAFTRTQLLEDATNGVLAARDSEARGLVAVVACRLTGTRLRYQAYDPPPVGLQQFAVLAGVRDPDAVPVTAVYLLGNVYGLKGDTLVLPVTREGLRTGKVGVTATAEDLHVQGGIVPYFGMSYADLARATVGDSLRHGTRLVRPRPK